MDLNTLWFIVIGFVLMIYIILDGYDLGIGILSLFTPRDKHKYREQLIQIIGPHWDSNEVWLIVFGGMLFAIFPRIYATLLSGLYLPFIFLLLVFIIRGISIPFRNRQERTHWLTFWDLCFGISSFLIAFILGNFLANLIQGIALNENGIMKFNLQRLVSPFSLLIGFFSVTLLSMHGAIYSSRKSRGEFGAFCRKAGLISWLLMLIFAIPAVLIVLINAPFNPLKNHFILFSLLLLVLIGCVVYVPLGLRTERINITFIASTFTIGCFLTILFLYSYPNLLHSTEPTRNLTIYNAASSTRTMKTTLILTVIAMPIVIVYSIFAHRIISRAQSD